MGVQRPQILIPDRNRPTPDVDCDVIVIGGGPAGLIAARELAAGGFSVSVLEEHDTIGAPVHCTGVLGLEAFDELALPRRAIVSIAQAARFISPSGSSLGIGADGVRAAIVDRATFDRDLSRAATAAGAAIRTGARVASLQRTPEAVTARTGDGDVRARAAIVACGASYRFNRAIGLGVPRVLVHSAQLELPFPPLEHVQVYFGRRVAPGGFAWLVPFVRDRATFAAMPLGPVARTWTDRVLVVGDAAGLVKPTTGGGIYYGLLTGHLAARVLGEALRRNTLHARALKSYEDQWRARLGPEIRAGLAFRAVASRLSDTAIDRLMDLARVDGIVPLLKQTADFNWHGAATRALLRHAGFRALSR
jgi:digeranylgeranylglycerophospholipid reductase